MMINLNDQPRIEALDWKNLKASEKFRLIAEIAEYLETVDVDDDGVIGDKVRHFIEEIHLIPYGYLYEFIKELLYEIEIYLGSDSPV